MQHRFIVGGGHACVSLSDLVEILKHGKWQIHDTAVGKLYAPLWVAEEVGEVLSHTMRLNTIRPRRNHYASELFGIELYGDCYLHSTEALNYMVVPAVCKFERDGKTLAQQEQPKAT